jgi:hypothetical protein
VGADDGTGETRLSIVGAAPRIRAGSEQRIHGLQRAVFGGQQEGVSPLAVDGIHVRFVEHQQADEILVAATGRRHESRGPVRSRGIDGGACAEQLDPHQRVIPRIRRDYQRGLTGGGRCVRIGAAGEKESDDQIVSILDGQ